MVEIQKTQFSYFNIKVGWTDLLNAKIYEDVLKITSKRKLTLEEYALLWITPKADQPLEGFEKHLKR